jgi:hypothetical protein
LDKEARKELRSDCVTAIGMLGEERNYVSREKSSATIARNTRLFLYEINGLL